MTPFPSPTSDFFDFDPITGRLVLYAAWSFALFEFFIEDAAPFVKEIVFDAEEKLSSLHVLHQAIIEDSAVNVFTRLAEFRHLHTLKLKFNFVFEENTVDRPLYKPTRLSTSQELQSTIIQAIVGNDRPPLLKHLELSGIVALPAELASDLFTTPELRCFLAPLDTLAINFLGDPGMFSGPYSDPLDFWTHSFPYIINSAPNLTSLSIACDEVEGTAYAEWMDIATLPLLTNLSLTSMMFSGAESRTTLEAFIMRHKNTLRTLKLDACSLINEEFNETNPRVWSHVWRNFRQLDLVHLNFRSGEERWALSSNGVISKRMRYHQYRGDQIMVPFLPINGEFADNVELSYLYRLTGLRNSEELKRLDSELGVVPQARF